MLEIDQVVKDPAKDTKSRKSKKKMFAIPEDKPIGEIFNYQNNMVKVCCMFMSLRDLFISQFSLGIISGV